jgi:hypothetical protein
MIVSLGVVYIPVALNMFLITGYYFELPFIYSCFIIILLYSILNTLKAYVSIRVILVYFWCILIHFRLTRSKRSKWRQFRT